MTGVTVCKDCSDRKVGCHGTCERYLKAVKQNNYEREMNRREMDNLYARATKEKRGNRY